MTPTTSRPAFSALFRRAYPPQICLCTRLFIRPRSNLRPVSVARQPLSRVSRQSPRERANYNPRWAQLIARARPSSTLPIKASIKASSRLRNPPFFLVDPPPLPSLYWFNQTDIVIANDNAIIALYELHPIAPATFPRVPRAEFRRRIRTISPSIARKRTEFEFEPSRGIRGRGGILVLRNGTGFGIGEKNRFQPPSLRAILSWLFSRSLSVR